MLSQDFLAPAVAALLFPDLMQRFFPFGFPDRAKALEQSWERAWGRAGLGEELWRDRGFRSLWAGGNFLPALFLNGTHVETGKRVITSNVDIAASPTVFRDVYDFYRLVPAGSEIRPSTAAHSSARFTYVSPAGTLSDGTHLVDGGYFENFGAVTGSEVLKAGIKRWGRAIQAVAILISNDPKLQEEDFRPAELVRQNPRPGPARPLSAAATDAPPAPSATIAACWTRWRMAAATSGRLTTSDPASSRDAGAHISGRSAGPPIPSTNVAVRAHGTGRPAVNAAARGAAVSTSQP